MCRLFNLHELITHTSWSYSSLRVTFLSNLQEGATLSSDNRPGVEFYGWFGFGSSLRKERCLSRYSGRERASHWDARWHACLLERDENKIFRIDYAFTSPSASVLSVDTSHTVTTNGHP
jgi:hypothetical protein